MPSLVRELQHDALQPNLRVSDLLRKSLVVARKLKLAESQEWVEFELNGYKDYSKTPDYRRLKGVSVAYDHYRGWYYLMPPELDAEFVEKIKTMWDHDPISRIESILEQKGGTIFYRYDHAQERILSKMLDYEAIPGLQIDRSQFQGILDAVRNIILEWTLKLEEDGILGENMTFTENEKRVSNSPVFNIKNFITQTNQAQSSDQIGGIKLGDEYKISGQLAAVGPGAHAHDINFNQIWNQMSGKVDLQQLAADLSRLRQEMMKDAVEPEQAIAVGEVARAEQAAKSGDGPNALMYLKAAGKWASDKAIEIGAKVAAEFITKSMNLDD
jgi:AbiTii-like protein